MTEAEQERDRCIAIIRARGKRIGGAIDPERTIAEIADDIERGEHLTGER